MDRWLNPPTKNSYETQVQIAETLGTELSFKTISEQVKKTPIEPGDRETRLFRKMRFLSERLSK